TPAGGARPHQFLGGEPAHQRSSAARSPARRTGALISVEGRRRHSSRVRPADCVRRQPNHQVGLPEASGRSRLEGVRQPGSRAVDTLTAVMNGDQRKAALRANIEAYGRFDEHAYIHGAPHLKHRSIAHAYSALVATAIERTGTDPHAPQVLELGAGNGLASTAWFERGAQLTAVDASESMLDDFKAKASEYGLTPNTVV